MAKSNWVEKLEAKDKKLPEIKVVKDKGMERWGVSVGETFVIPHPKDVYEAMGKVSKGKLVTTAEIREYLAKKHKAKIACPLTTGIFAWISANAVCERKEMGQNDPTPYWRTLKTNGEINPKYPGGIEDQKKLLQSEGHKILEKGKKFFVVDYQNCLEKL